MARREVFPIINCERIDETTAFYERVLGGVLDYRFPTEGEADYLTLTVGAGTVALGRGTGPAMYGEVPRPATGHAVDLCIYVPDLDAVIAAAPGAGGAVRVEPTDMPWGERVAYVEDPEGTLLLVIQDEP